MPLKRNQTNKMKKLELHWKIIIGMVLGVIYGLIASKYGWIEFTDHWIKPGGIMIMGIDHYIGNPNSYSWSDDLNVYMALMTDMEWKNIFYKSGLDNCKSWNVNQKDDGPGTLVISGQLI